MDEVAPDSFYPLPLQTVRDDPTPDIGHGATANRGEIFSSNCPTITHFSLSPSSQKTCCLGHLVPVIQIVKLAGCDRQLLINITKLYFLTRHSENNFAQNRSHMGLTGKLVEFILSSLFWVMLLEAGGCDRS